MNRKGFAISTITYVIVLLIISLLYILLGIMRNRYTINDDLRKNIVANLNNEEYLNYGDINSCTLEDVIVVDSCENVSYTNNVTCILNDNQYEMHIYNDDCLINNE